MAILLTPDEIPKFWEAIKFAAVNFDFVEEEYRPRYLNRLLYLLLSGKAQCFVRLDAERRLQMICITKITVDEIRDERTLFGVGIYSFNKVDNSIWNGDLNTVIEFAKANKCKFISSWVVNEKASNLLKSIGFKHRFDVLMLDLNGGA